MKKLAIGMVVAVLVLSLIITLIALFTPYTHGLELMVRLFALWGFLMLAIATMMTPYLKQIYQLFGKPFIKIHHIFAILGIAFITAHPIAFAIETMNILVFVPNFSSWILFWSLAGRPALILFYIALVGVLLRTKIKTHWRAIHAIMYIVLIFGFVHTILS